jgi:hypothetical protein
MTYLNVEELTAGAEILASTYPDLASLIRNRPVSRALPLAAVIC